MSDKKTVTVLGALGAQGGSVVASLLKDGSFKVRAVTRSVDSDAAKALKDQGVDVTVGDTKKPESLTEAFQDADAAFIVVNFWDPDIMLKELDITKAVLDVAKKAGVKHCVYAGLADVETISDGKLNVPHFTMKAKAFEYAKTLGFPYVTDVEAAFYYSNWLTFLQPKEEDGALVVTLPGKGKISQYDPRTDTGPATVAVMKDPEKYNNKQILLEGDCLTPDESAELLTKAIGKPVRMNFVEPSVYATFFPGAEEVSEMFKHFDQYGYYGPETEERKHSSGKETAGSLLSLQDWLDTKAYEKLLSK